MWKFTINVWLYLLAGHFRKEGGVFRGHKAKKLCRAKRQDCVHQLCDVASDQIWFQRWMVRERIGSGRRFLYLLDRWGFVYIWGEESSSKTEQYCLSGQHRCCDCHWEHALFSVTSLIMLIAASVGAAVHSSNIIVHSIDLNIVDL